MSPIWRRRRRWTRRSYRRGTGASFVRDLYSVIRTPTIERSRCGSSLTFTRINSWIGHDKAQSERLKYAPAYYDQAGRLGRLPLRHLYGGQPLDDRHHHAGVLLAEPRRQRRLLIALGHVREADGDVELLGDGVEGVQVLVHQRDLEAGLEVARDQGLRDPLERLAATARRLDDLVDRHRIE